MKKLIVIVALLSVGVLLAAPKNSLNSLASCLWSLDGSSNLVADNTPGTRFITITAQGGITSGEYADYWYGDPKRQFISIINGEFESPDRAGFFGGWFNESTGVDNAAFAYAKADMAHMAVRNYESGSGVESIAANGGVVTQYKVSNQILAYIEPARPVGNPYKFGGLEIEHGGAVKAGGAEAWKLGSIVPATVQLVTDRYVQVEIGGQIVKLAIVE